MKVTIDISDQTLAELLCDAFEGGCSYWMRIYERVSPNGKPVELKGFEDEPNITWPLSPGGAVTIRVLEDDGTDTDEVYRVNRAALLRGLLLTAERYPHIFARIVEEDVDIEVADVLLQCACLGEVRYG